MQGKKRSKVEHLASIFNAADAVFFGAWRTDAALPSADDLSEKVRGELTVALHREISRVRPKLIISFGDFLLKTLTKRLDFQIDLNEDQLYMIDLAGHSYCLYPMPEVFRPDWEQALDKLERIDFLRLRKILNELAAARAGETAGVVSGAACAAYSACGVRGWGVGTLVIVGPRVFGALPSMIILPWCGRRLVIATARLV